MNRLFHQAVEQVPTGENVSALFVQIVALNLNLLNVFLLFPCHHFCFSSVGNLVVFNTSSANPTGHRSATEQ